MGRLGVRVLLVSCWDRTPTPWRNRMRTTPTLATLSVLALMSGCTPAAPTAPPTPAAPPTQAYYCTPDGATAGAPCSKEEYDAQLERDKHYEEAEQVYRDLLEADKKIFLAGGEADETVLQYAVGDARDILIQSHEGRPRLVSGEVVIPWIRRSPEAAGPGDAVVLTACIDNTKAHVEVEGDGGSYVGSVAHERVHFVREGEALKISRFASKEVESC